MSPTASAALRKQPMIEETFDPAPAQAFAAIARQVIYTRTRYGADGRVEFSAHDGWTSDLHQAYIAGEHQQKNGDIPFLMPLSAERGGDLSQIEISIYDRDAAPKAPASITPLSPRAAVIGQWQDHVAMARPKSADGMPVLNATPLFIAPHGHLENTTVLAPAPSSAIACAAAFIDRTLIDQLDGAHSKVGWPNWAGHSLTGFRPAVRTISISSYHPA